MSSNSSLYSKLTKEKLLLKADRIAAQKNKTHDKLQDLPADLQLVITFYLAPRDLVFNV